MTSGKALSAVLIRHVLWLWIRSSLGVWVISMTSHLSLPVLLVRIILPLVAIIFNRISLKLVWRQLRTRLWNSSVYLGNIVNHVSWVRASRRELFLMDVEQESSPVIKSDRVSDVHFKQNAVKDFVQLQKSLKLLSLNDLEIKALYQVVAACMHLASAGTHKGIAMPGRAFVQYTSVSVTYSNRGFASYKYKI